MDSQSQAVSGSELLLQMEHVKYRQTGPGKSPIGIDDKLVVAFSQIKVQRISPPNKPRIQLQICMNNDDQATFVFMRPSVPQEELCKDRDIVREALQQALIHHRQIMSQNASKAEENGNREFQIKKRALEENAHLHSLYLHLVGEKLITAQDFWTFHYKPDTQNEINKGGISGGFLSSIVPSEGVNGIKLNLTLDTIQAIFRTYPAVERKHLELVPHEMNNQEFWSKFFQSHYFHRERTAEPNPNDPFAECVKMDDKDMKQILEQGEHSLRKHLNLSDLNDDFGIFSEMRDNHVSVRGNAAKATLVRRCNYHSGRVLSTIKESSENFKAGLTNGEGPATNGESSKTKFTTIFEINLDSQELEDLDKDAEEPFASINMQSTSNCGSLKTYSPVDAMRYRKSVNLCAGKSVLSPEASNTFFDTISTEIMDESDVVDDDNLFFTGLSPKAIEKIRIVHTCLVELLRHFWSCFPPITPELEEKMEKMNGTLLAYEKKQLRECEKQFGTQYVMHCRQMLEKAKQRFQAYSAHKQRPHNQK